MYFVFILENRVMVPVQTVLRRFGREMRGNDRRRG
jgi:hypothetical protein